MPKGAYLVTTADVSDPVEARRLLRKTDDGKATLLESMGVMGRMYADSYLLPTDAVLLMIGNTPELTEEVDVAQNGFDRVIGEDWPQLECYYKRVNVSPVQNDTILAIGPTQYWDQVGRQQALNNGWTHLQGYDSQSIRPRELTAMIEKCKELG